jgi:predicted RNase H-like nuclease
MHFRVFGKRYREVIRGWEASVREGGTNDRRCALNPSSISAHATLIDRIQDKLVWVGAQHVLCRDSQGARCCDRRARAWHSVRRVVCGVVDLQLGACLLCAGRMRRGWD